MKYLLLPLLALAATGAPAEPNSNKISKLAEKLVPLAADPVLVDAIRSANLTNLGQATIKQLDEKWIAASDRGVIEEFMRPFLNSDAGKRLATLKRERKFILELFATDKRGVNVAMAEPTSDYWQGDEKKITECLKGEKGKIFVGPIEYDESSQMFQTQISVPVLDGGKAIGVLVVGVDVDGM